MIGSVIDKYEILQKIGEGGMATVYRGRHTTLGRDVAIKVLHPHLSRSERNRQRFAREARAIEHLNHDNILKIFDYSGTEADDCFIVTEFVDGMTLQALTAEFGRFPSEVATIVGIKLAEALQYAHDLGIIHRDLKPENVMVRRDGEVKLMDFGIARFLDEVHLTVTGALVGSPAYMSPEQAMERVLDPRSDLFSLGTLLFHVATGQLPFSGSNPSIILRNIIEGNRPEMLELAPAVSGTFADVVERLLQSDANDRPTTAADVHLALMAVLDEVEIAVDDPAWSLQSWLGEPDAYAARLQAHLSTVLLTRGRTRLDDGDHLGALRLFNRLLAVDENNSDVMALVQGMHVVGPPATERKRRWWAAGVLGVAAAGLISWVLWPDPGASLGTLPVADTEAFAAARVDERGQPGAVRTAGPALAAREGEAGSSTEPIVGASANPTEGPASTRQATETPGDAPEGAPGVEALPAGGSKAKAVRGTDGAGGSGGKRPTRGSGAGGSGNPNTAASRTAGSTLTETDAAIDVQTAAPGLVTVVVPGSWGHIYIDGDYKGRTGEVSAIRVMAGKHVLRVENDLSLPYERTFEVAGGEPLTVEVEGLQPKPTTARFAPELAGTCEIFLDGSPRGTVGALGGELRIHQPASPHRMLIACPDEDAHEIAIAATLPGSVIEVGTP